jgi:ketosteroid isomerase-like protein
MNVSNTQDVAVRFNDAINARDLDGLAALMTDDHRFVDTEERADVGKTACVQSWRGFFEQFPDYRNVFMTIVLRGDVVLAVGYSTCSFAALAGPAIWKATIRGNKVAEWRVYNDSEATRQTLNLTGEG